MKTLVKMLFALLVATQAWAQQSQTLLLPFCEQSVKVPSEIWSQAKAFRAEGAEVRFDFTDESLFLSPTTKNVKVVAEDDKGQPVWFATFVTVNMPMPEPFVQTANNKVVDFKEGLYVSDIAAGLRVKAKIAERNVDDYQRFCIQKPNFEVGKTRIALIRNKTTIMTLESADGTFDLTALAAQARPGDTFQIEIKEMFAVVNGIKIAQDSGLIFLNLQVR